MTTIYQVAVSQLISRIKLYKKNNSITSDVIEKSFFKLSGSEKKYDYYYKFLIVRCISIFFVRIYKQIFLEGYAHRSRMVTKMFIFFSYVYVKYQLEKIRGHKIIDHNFLQDASNAKYEDDIIKYVSGSPICLIKYPWVYLICIKKNFALSGIIHGAGYNEFTHNEIEKFERTCSDSYYGWGLDSKFNKKCYRYRNKNFYNIKRRFSGNIVIPDFNYNNLTTLKFQIPSAFLILSQLSRNRFHVYMNNLKSSILIKPHPGFSLQYPHNIKTTKCISRGDLILIDHPYSSFLYKCIFERLPFVIVYNKKWHDLFSKEFNKFLMFAYKNKVLFYDDEIELLTEYLSNENYTTIVSNSTKLRFYLKNNVTK